MKIFQQANLECLENERFKMAVRFLKKVKFAKFKLTRLGQQT